MAQSLTPDRPRAAIAVLALILMAFAPAAWAQIAVIVLGALAGLVVCRQGGDVAVAAVEAPISRRAAIVFAALAFALLALSFAPVLPGAAALAAAFYRSGALVFGGGHVVLPLLRTAVVDPGWVSGKRLSGRLRRGPGRAGAAVHLRCLSRRGRRRWAGRRRRGGVGAGCDLRARTFAADGGPSVLERLARPRNARAAMAGVNAAVVGLLASALYDPVWTGAVRGPTDFAIAAAGFVALIVWRAPPLIVVIADCGRGDRPRPEPRREREHIPEMRFDDNETAVAGISQLSIRSRSERIRETGRPRA